MGKRQGGRTNFHKHLLCKEPWRGIGLCLSCALALPMVSEAVTATVGSTGSIRITERPKLTTAGIYHLRDWNLHFNNLTHKGLTNPNPLRAPGARCWLGHFFLAASVVPCGMGNGVLARVLLNGNWKMKPEITPLKPLVPGNSFSTGRVP